MPNEPIAPRLPPLVPQNTGRVRRAVGSAGLRLLGWHVEPGFPDVAKAVIIVAPHTSNWDFVIGFLTYLALRLDATWFGKHSLFLWPLGPILRYFGGIPVERSKAGNVVDLYVQEFHRRDRMVLALAPEGTRSRVADWKSGFYHIAVGAGATIAPVAFDYQTKRVRFFPALVPSGDPLGDVQLLRSYFSPAMARYPEAYHAT